MTSSGPPDPTSSAADSALPQPLAGQDERLVAADQRQVQPDLARAEAGVLPVDALTAALRAQSEDMSLYAGFLLSTLVGALPPELLQVTRRKGGLRQRFAGGEAPVVECVVTVGDRRYALARAGVGAPGRASIQHVVGGVVLSSTSVPLDRWAQELAAALARQAEQNATVRAAMERLLTPGG